VSPDVSMLDRSDKIKFHRDHRTTTRCNSRMQRCFRTRSRSRKCDSFPPRSFGRSGISRNDAVVHAVGLEETILREIEAAKLMRVHVRDARREERIVQFETTG